MPVITNPKHEHFAQLLAKGKKQKDAYALAGYRGDEAAASKLAHSEKIQKRVGELLGRAARRTEITIADIASQLDDDREFAQKVKQAGAAVSATMGKAKVLGLLSDKVEHSGGVSITIAGRDTDL